MSRASRTRINLTATAVLSLVLVAMVNYLSSRHYKRWDWTDR